MAGCALTAGTNHGTGGGIAKLHAISTFVSVSVESHWRSFMPDSVKNGGRDMARAKSKAKAKGKAKAGGRNAANATPALLERLKKVEHDLGMLQDVHAIRRLQHAYGFYIDKCLYNETVDLFAEDSQVIFMGGIFRGKAGARRLYCDRFRKNFTGGKNGPVYGFLLDHYLGQDIIDVAPDRKTAF